MDGTFGWKGAPPQTQMQRDHTLSPQFDTAQHRPESLHIGDGLEDFLSIAGAWARQPKGKGQTGAAQSCHLLNHTKPKKTHQTKTKSWRCVRFAVLSWLAPMCPHPHPRGGLGFHVSGFGLLLVLHSIVLLPP